MARTAYEAVKETGSNGFWSLKCVEEHQFPCKIDLKIKPRTLPEQVSVLRELTKRDFSSSKSEGNGVHCALIYLKSSLEAKSTLSAYPNELLLPPIPTTPLPNVAKVNQSFKYKVLKAEEDPVKSDVTNKTGPSGSSPFSNSSPGDLAGINELYLDDECEDQLEECDDEPLLSTLIRPSPGRNPSRQPRVAHSSHGKKLHRIKEKAKAKEREAMMMNMRTVGRAPVDYVSSSDDEPEPEESTLVQDYCIFDSSDKAASLVDIPYDGDIILTEDPPDTQFYLTGSSADGTRKLFYPVDQWKIQMTDNANPTLNMRSPLAKTGDGLPESIWIELGKPDKSYVKYLKIVLVAAHLLSFVKLRPGGSRPAAWKYVWKEIGSYYFQPSLKEPDLDKAIPLVQQLAAGDPVLKTAEILAPLAASGPARKLKTAAGRGHASTSGASAKRKEFGYQKPPSKRKKLNSLKDKDDLSDSSLIVTEEWTDEPNVCMFCDDGVDGDHKLLCCDGGCMRSFHVSRESANDFCQTLNLDESVLKDDEYFCPNCKFKQHQCFACNKLGRSCKTATAPQEVFCCSARLCKRYYHLDCVDEKFGQKDPHSESFICPLHKCRRCGMGERKGEAIIKCRRCPKAWHRKCSNAKENENLWVLEDGKIVFYCKQHKIEDGPRTPIQNHIIFPDGDSALRGAPTTSRDNVKVKGKSSSKRNGPRGRSS